MALGAQVDIKRPLKVAKEANEVTIVKNLATPTVYYKTGPLLESVSSSTNDGSLAKGASLTLSQTTAFIASEGGAQVEIRAFNDPTEQTESPNLKEFGYEVGMGKDDTNAINSAIASLPANGSAGTNGGVIEVPTGVYLHEGEPNFKEKTNIRFLGKGALVAAGAIGTARPNIGSTVFIHTGKGPRAWDFRSNAGCGLENIHCFAWGSGFTGPIWDLSGTEAQPGLLSHFVNSVAEATRVGGKSTEKILHCIGANLDYSNAYHFDNCIFSGCLEGVQGITTASHSSVAHRFTNCFFAGNQVRHVSNPQEAWKFDSCIAESLFSDEGVISNKAGFIGYTGAGFKTHGLNLDNCWSGSNVPAAREGANVEFIGDGLNMTGGSYNTGEIGVYFPEGSLGNVVTGVRFWKLAAGVQFAAGASFKAVESDIKANKYLECTTPFIEPTSATKYVSSIIDIGKGEALKVS